MPYLGQNLGSRYPAYEKLHVPSFVNIPTTDIAAWTHFEKYRWVYDKMRLAESQHMECGPLGIIPKKFPVFLKPIYNLYGGSISAYKIDDIKMYDKHQNFHPGRFWVEFFEGDHLQHDLAIYNGEIVWSNTFLGLKFFLGDKYTGAFDYWERQYMTEEMSSVLQDWVTKHMPDYSGVINCETIGCNIIEVHLRFGNVLDLQDVNIMDSFIKLYTGKKWALPTKPFKEFYIFSIFGEKEMKYIAPTEASIESNMESFNILDYRMELDGGTRTPPLIKRIGWFTSYSRTAGLDVRNWIIKRCRPKIPKIITDGLT